MERRNNYATIIGYSRRFSLWLMGVSIATEDRKMKVEFSLTKQQMKVLQPMFEEVEKVANNGGDLSSILGQVWGPGEHKEGIASFHLLNSKQATIVHRAIVKALKVK